MRVLSETGSLIFQAGEPILFRVLDHPAQGLLHYALWVDEPIRTGVIRLGAGWDPLIRLEQTAPGHYSFNWFLEQEDQVVEKGSCEFSVLEERPAVSRRFQLDGALTGLGRGQTAALVAAAVESGTSWIRDRCYWTDEGLIHTEALVAQETAGLKTLVVVSELPPSVSLGRSDGPPRDLKSVYRFFATASARFPRAIAGWEIWNEADGSFYQGPPEEFAAYVKAAALGIWRGNPQARVVLGGWANYPTPWLQQVFASGVGDYYQVYGLHYYGNLANLWTFLHAHQEVLKAQGLTRPIWITEMGESAAQPRLQASYQWQGLPLGVIGGADRVFSFLLPSYEEGPTSYGLLNPDGSPRPAYTGLALLIRTLGEATPLGFVVFPGGGLGLLFDTGETLALVAWTGEMETVTLPGRNLEVQVQGGSVYRLTAEGDQTKVTLFSSAQIIRGLSGPPTGLIPVRPGPSRVSVPAPSEVVLHLRLDPASLPGRGREPYEAPAGRVFPALVRAYNFGEDPAILDLDLELPANWTVSGFGERRITLAPGAFYERRVLLTGSRPSEPSALTLRGRVQGEELPPSVAFAGVTS